MDISLMPNRLDNAVQGTAVYIKHNLKLHDVESPTYKHKPLRRKSPIQNEKFRPLTKETEN